jgi:hypothetical protein
MEKNFVRITLLAWDRSVLEELLTILRGAEFKLCFNMTGLTRGIGKSDTSHREIRSTVTSPTSA